MSSPLSLCQLAAIAAICTLIRSTSPSASSARARQSSVVAASDRDESARGESSPSILGATLPANCSRILSSSSCTAATTASLSSSRATSTSSAPSRRHASATVQPLQDSASEAASEGEAVGSVARVHREEANPNPNPTPNPNLQVPCVQVPRAGVRQRGRDQEGDLSPAALSPRAPSLPPRARGPPGRRGLSLPCHHDGFLPRGGHPCARAAALDCVPAICIGVGPVPI
mmetsp:Transcript_73171/g.145533  ORF Transcript_73171/g.145533 Transcript_73171/m.145533 type:complete len:229 (+) Transcript_73171:618-1304(+)